MAFSDIPGEVITTSARGNPIPMVILTGCRALLQSCLSRAPHACMSDPVLGLRRSDTTAHLIVRLRPERCGCIV